MSTFSGNLFSPLKVNDISIIISFVDEESEVLKRLSYLAKVIPSLNGL